MSDETKRPPRKAGGMKRRPEGGKPGTGKPGTGKRFSAKPASARPRPEAAEGAAASGEERIAKRLARAGIASRRDAEVMIAAGRVTVNGRKVDSPALNVGPRDRITVDDQPLPAAERTRLFLFHKPAGVVTTSRDPEGRRTVFDVLPKGLPRLITIGRLDINTEGLLLFTNDGGLARVLELPATGWLRRYRVRVHGTVNETALAGLKDGIAVDGVFYGAIEATLDRVQGSNAWLNVGLREGKNREVKNVLSALGLDVNRLIRLSYGPFQLGDLGEGELRELRGRYLRDQLGERLIAEAGADFDSPILNELPPTASESAKDPAGDDRSPRPNRKREREAKRESALGRLQTSSGPRPGKPHGKPKRKHEPEAGRDAAPEQRRSRTANVWMAPGARPLGEKKLAEKAEQGEGRRYAGKPRPQSAPGKPSSAGKTYGGGGKAFGGAGKASAGGRDARDGKPGGRPPRGGKPNAPRSSAPRSDRPGGRPPSSGPRKPRGRG